MAIIARLLWTLARAVLWCLVVEVLIELVHRWLHRQEEKRAEDGKEPLFESGVPATPILNILGNHPNPVPEAEDRSCCEEVGTETTDYSETPLEEPAPAPVCTSIIPHGDEKSHTQAF